MLFSSLILKPFVHVSYAPPYMDCVSHVRQRRRSYVWSDSASANRCESVLGTSWLAVSKSLWKRKKKNCGGNCRNWWQLNSYQTYGNIGPPPPFFQFPSSSSSSSFVVISTFFFIISLSSRFLVLRPLVSFFSLVTLHPSIQTLCVYFTLQLKMASEGEGDIEMSIVSVTV